MPVQNFMCYISLCEGLHTLNVNMSDYCGIGSSIILIFAKGNWEMRTIKRCLILDLGFLFLSLCVLLKGVSSWIWGFYFLVLVW